MSERASLVWVGPIFEATGYADEARGLLTALEARGMPVALRAVAERQLPDFRQALPVPMQRALRAQEARSIEAPYVLVQHFPADGFVPALGARLVVGRTMFETDGLPASWVARCNAMDALWVPSAFNADTFRRAGVRTPITIVQGGVDSSVYRPDGSRYPIADARACVFLSLFEWRARKGWDVLLRAWAEAFAPDDDVTLVLRCSVPRRPATEETAAWLSRRIDAYLLEALGRERGSVAPIHLIPQVVSESELPALYRAATAYVSPTRGEGWGRPFMEAMATGLPVIATRWSAHLDYLTDDTGLLVDIERLVPAHDPELPLYEGTQWAEPSIDHLVRQLRRVYEDRAAAAALGARARASMIADWSWDRAARAVVEAMDALEPKRRAPAPPVRAATHPCRLRPFRPATETAPLAPTERATPRLWFAMLTYNALAYTRRAIASLDRHTDESWHLFILDNGSTDGTREWLATLDDPRIEVEESITNRGVAGGRNDCVARLRDRVPDDGYIIFVDNDLEFFPGWLEPFRALLARRPAPGIVSSSGFEIAVHEAHRELLSYPALVPLPVDVAAGGFACFVSPAVFRAIGRYDEALNPFWHEDDDITVRARAAGFDTFAVPTLGVVHHGHKSGAAIPALVHGGSRSKQAYLVNKWRAAGWVADDGRLTVGRVSDTEAEGWRMADHMRRPPPLMASEISRAGIDAGLVERAVNAGHEVAARYASAPALAWCEVRAASTDPLERLRWAPIRDLLRAIRDTRRRLTRLPSADGAPALSALADSRHWHDHAWFARAVDAAGDGRGRLQWFDRSAGTWDATQVAQAHAVHTADRGPARRVLFIGDLRRPIVWHLAMHTDTLIVGDVITRHGATAEARVLADVERFALREVPPGRVQAMSVESVASTVTPGSVDLAVILPWDPHAPLADVSALLQFVRPLLAPTGWLCTTLPVRLAGPPDTRALEAPQRLGTHLARVGYAPLDQPQVAMSDEGLLAATDREGLGSRTPDLLIVDGARITGRLFVTATPLT